MKISSECQYVKSSFHPGPSQRYPPCPPRALAPAVESRAGRQRRFFSTHRTANRTSPLQREGFLLNPVPVWN
jgi:hypothetical protein